MFVLVIIILCTGFISILFGWFSVLLVSCPTPSFQFSSSVARVLVVFIGLVTGLVLGGGGFGWGLVVDVWLRLNIAANWVTLLLVFLGSGVVFNWL